MIFLCHCAFSVLPCTTCCEHNTDILLHYRFMGGGANTGLSLGVGQVVYSQFIKACLLPLASWTAPQEQWHLTKQSSCGPDQKPAERHSNRRRTEGNCRVGRKKSLCGIITQIKAASMLLRQTFRINWCLKITVTRCPSALYESPEE